MTKYKKIGDKLAVKGLGVSGSLKVTLFIFFLFICISLIFSIILMNETDAFGITLIVLTEILFMIAFLLCIKGSIYYFKRVIIFNKKRGSIEVFNGDNYKKISLGKLVNWRIQKIIGKSGKYRITSYSAVLVGTKNNAILGITSLTKSGTIKKLHTINEYLCLNIESSEYAIDSYEWLNQCNSHSI